MNVWISGVQAHPHPHAVCSNERTLGGDGCRHGIAGSLKGDEEGVSLGIDLVPVMGLKAFAECSTMLRTQVAPLGAVPARKLRRALDVAEKKRHGPVWQTSPHPRMLRRAMRANL
jgi:hypothetical protein